MDRKEVMRLLVELKEQRLIGFFEPEEKIAEAIEELSVGL